jgi:type II secretory pathway pseudopilin PulG
MLRFNLKKTFTLIEAIIVVVVFAVVISATGGVLFSILRTQHRLDNRLKAIREVNWAIDFLAKDLRNRTGVVVPAPSGGIFPVGTNNYTLYALYYPRGTTRVWYWRGDDNQNASCANNGYCFGDSTKLYRGVDTTPGVGTLGNSIARANSTAFISSTIWYERYNRIVVGDYLTNNPNNTAVPPVPYPVFAFSTTWPTNVLEIMLTVHDPTPGRIATRGDPHYTVRRRIYLRNIP